MKELNYVDGLKIVLPAPVNHDGHQRVCQSQQEVSKETLLQQNKRSLLATSSVEPE